MKELWRPEHEAKMVWATLVVVDIRTSKTYTLGMEGDHPPPASFPLCGLNYNPGHAFFTFSLPYAHYPLGHLCCITIVMLSDLHGQYMCSFSMHFCEILLVIPLLIFMQGRVN